MNKFGADHRKSFGDFEALDYIDETEIAEIRGRLDIDNPTQVRWNSWDYGSEVAELRRLYEKGKTAQWNATSDIDWSIPLSKDEWIGLPDASLLANICKMMGKDEATQKAAMFDEVGWMMSQLLHGEQAALQICGQLTNLCPTTDEKFYAAAQVADEARHTEVFARLLSEKFGTIHPICPVIKTLLDAMLSANGYHMKTLGMQTLFEGFAMGLMDLLRQNLRNPLLLDVLRRVIIDEARHAAFGVLTTRRVVSDADDGKREAMEDWSFSLLEALNANQNLSMLRQIGPKYDLDPDAITHALLAQPDWADMNSLVFMHTVVPNLVRLGLISDRTEEKWQRLGMLSDIRKAKGGPTKPDVS